MEISKRKIKLIMGKQLLTTKALSEKMGVQPNNLSTILTRGTCRPETACRIAKALDVDVTEIMMEE